MAGLTALMRSGPRRRSWRVLLAATLVAGWALAVPAPTGQAHTCTPDASVGVSGRLVVPRASGLAVIGLPGRDTRAMPILPSRGVASAVAASADGSLLAVSRFWRPPDQRVGGQDILLVGPSGGEPVAMLERSQPGEVLAAPSWLPDGSLIFARSLLSDTYEGARIERARPGEQPELIAAGAAWPSVSSDGTLLAMVRPTGEEAGYEKLVVRPTAGGPELVLVDLRELPKISFPRFSPDGSWIAFSAETDPANLPVGLPAAGRAPDDQAVASRLTSLAAAMRLPLLDAQALSIGARVARAHGVPWDVWVVRPDGTGLHRLTAFQDDDSSVAWSPDGRHIATFSADAIHVVSLDGTEAYCISAEGGYGAIEWLP